MTPDQYYGYTFEEIVSAVQAHRENVTEGWRQTRLIGYLMYCANTDGKKRRVSIYEFLPLHGDPTEEEIKQMEEERIKNEIQEIESIKKFYRDKGLLN